MPWGFECRARLLKQVPAKPTERRGPRKNDQIPGPSQYETPQIFCGPGHCHIKRAPAFTFGHQTPVSFCKPVLKSNAPMLNVQGLGRRGRVRITHSVVTPRIETATDHLNVPGPGAYASRPYVQSKRPPSFTCRPAAQPPYQPWDMWTPPPNMYWPAKPHTNPPMYSLGYTARLVKPPDTPGPGEHEPNYNYVKKTKPSFSFGAPFRHPRPVQSPAPNRYCEKKFMVSKRTIPAPSFGILHSPYCGKQEEYLKDSTLDIHLVSGT